jgi:hypothetical protein
MVAGLLIMVAPVDHGLDLLVVLTQVPIVVLLAFAWRWQPGHVRLLAC